MKIEPATIEDAADILALQRAAYQQVGQRYNDFGIPPLTETLDDTEDQLSLQTVLKVCLGEDIIGSVRAFQNNSVCYIGRLIVAPTFQGQGIGTALLLSMEGCFPEAQEFELFTGHKCEDNLRLYARLGYEEIGREPVSDKVIHVILRKEHVTGGGG